MNTEFDLAYYSGRLHTSLTAAAAAQDACARKSHDTLAEAYRRLVTTLASKE